MAKRSPTGITIVHCKKKPYDVYIGRPSKWGNPFKIGEHGTREEVIRKYEEWIRQQPELMASLPELRGMTLGCWCPVSKCHGQVLIRLVEELDAQGVASSPESRD